MGSKTNRSLERNHLKGRSQRIEAGRIEGTKLAFLATPKSAVRAELAMVQLVPKNCNARTIIEPSDVSMVPYMPHRGPRKWTPAQLAYVNFAPELIKRA